MNKRETEVRQARSRISDAQLTEFLRAAAQSEYCPPSIGLIKEMLDEGQSLDQIFYTGDEKGFSLSVKRFSDLRIRITVGGYFDPVAGDGSEWDVSFDSLGQLKSAALVPGTYWIS